MIPVAQWYNLTAMTEQTPASQPGCMVLMTRLAKQAYRRSDEQSLGMHLRLLIALSYVRDHSGGPQQELADALCMDANNVVLLLNELEDLGYVARRRDPGDRRRHLVEITATGLTALSAAEREQERVEDEILSGLSAEDRATLRRLLASALYDVEPDDAAAAQAGVPYSTTIASIST
ncbi:MAG TPA: MarR family winged helix-turn-helix transcriptional regulator [Solirubrobacteraceae bacterium]